MSAFLILHLEQMWFTPSAQPILRAFIGIGGRPNRTIQALQPLTASCAVDGVHDTSCV
jgi:hypothetical protein